LAVASDKQTVTKEFDSGHGPDRQANMIEFAVSALKLLKEAITDKDGTSKLV
jgi:hypothetical protein